MRLFEARSEIERTWLQTASRSRRALTSLRFDGGSVSGWHAAM